MISPNLYAIWVFLFLNLSQDLKLVLLRYFGTLGDGYSLKGSNKKPSQHNHLSAANNPLLASLGTTVRPCPAPTGPATATATASTTRALDCE
jgi:hypothetical protein